MIALIKSNLSGRKVLLLFLLTNVVYATMLLYTIPKLETFSGGMKILDMLPGTYDLAYVRSLFNALGEPGRHFYLTRQLPLDLFYPGLFGISYSLLFGYFLKKLGKLNSRYFYLAFLPLAAGLFDYLENAGIAVMLKSYPDLPPFWVTLTSIFSLLKSSLSSVFFIALLLAILVFAGRLVFKKSAPTKAA
ncbi:hypothetical protein [Adhaeribacter soli]|uniref:Uncharacterized protein n=1 Tax=Adhaeribacter soli TaxID=2607655 RepID=A0A5N1IXL3_9BACT|nr:hypothetical protein [Adhaeribacter soli]KAA9332793.1 hypothetical protein F0P94_12410 [Adhaeribacter soli]